MTPSVETFEASVQRLVGNFETDHDHHLSKQYVEAQARVDFITASFEALGWGVNNEAGPACKLRIEPIVTFAHANQR